MMMEFWDEACMNFATRPRQAHKNGQRRQPWARFARLASGASHTSLVCCCNWISVWKPQPTSSARTRKYYTAEKCFLSGLGSVRRERRLWSGRAGKNFLLVRLFTLASRPISVCSTLRKAVLVQHCAENQLSFFYPCVCLSSR